jgi:chromate transport protein ChrA
MRPQPTVWQGGNFRPAPIPKAKTSKPIYFNEAQRTALAMMLTGVLYGILSMTVLLIGTNHMKHPVAGRALSQFRLVIAGLITIISTAIAMSVVAQEGKTPWAVMAVLSGFLLVWGPTAFIHLMIMLMSVYKTKEKAKVDSDYYRGPGSDESPAESEPETRRSEPEPRRPRGGDDDGRRPTWKE